MFRELRRSNKKMEDSEAAELLTNGEYGILSTIGEDGYPYGIPVNYAYCNNEIFIHCATEGHKIDNIKYSNKVSFCVVGGTNVVPEKFTTKFSSVIVFGRIEEALNDDKNRGLLMICQKYSSEYIEEANEYIQRAFEKVRVYKINIEYITGKKSV